jgi:hypothetical protein
VRAAFEEIFMSNNVDINVFGHVHAYERMLPVYQNTTVHSAYDSLHTIVGAKAPVNIITGVPG